MKKIVKKGCEAQSFIFYRQTYQYTDISLTLTLSCRLRISFWKRLSSALVVAIAVSSLCGFEPCETVLSSFAFRVRELTTEEGAKPTRVIDGEYLQPFPSRNLSLIIF